MNTTNTKAVIDPSLLTKKELAGRLKMTPRAVQKMVADRRIPCIRISHHTLRFKWEAVERALDKLTVREAGAR